MSFSDNIDSIQRSFRSRECQEDIPRQASARLPTRAHRRRRQRPAIDPTLEQFLVGFEHDLKQPVTTDVNNPLPAPGWRNIGDILFNSLQQRESIHDIAPEPLIPGHNAHPALKRSGFERIARILFRKYPIFILVTVLAWSAAGIYVSVVAPVYESSTTLLVNTSGLQKLTGSRSDTAPGTGFVPAKRTPFPSSPAELANRAATELANVRTRSPGLVEWTIFNRGKDAARKGETLAWLLENKYVTLSMALGGVDSPDTITISVKSTDPAEAALIANIYGNAYSGYVDALMSQHFDERLLYYSDKNETARFKLDEISEELNSFLQINGTLFGKEESSHVLSQISSLTASLDLSGIEIKELEASIASFEKEIELMDSQPVVDGALAPGSDSGATSFAEKLRRGRSENNVLLRAAKAKESAILTRLAYYKTLRRTIPEREAAYREISDRHSIATRHVFDLQESIRLVEEASRTRASFVQVAETAVKPTSDSRLTLLFGAMFGLFAGLVAAFASEKTDKKIYEAVDVERLGVDVICSVPMIRNIERKKLRVFYERKISSEMIAILNPGAPATLSLRSIPLRIAGHTLNHSVFVFTGVDQGVGTSFLAANTAALLARSGARVLLVDANIGRPSIVNMLGLTNQSGFDLVSCSFGSGKGLEVFSSHLPSLFVLALQAPSGVNANHLLSRNLKSLIERARKQFDAVIVDTASLWQSTAAHSLSSLADETVIVVRSGATDTRRMKEVMDDFRSMTGSSPRAVLNGFGRDNITRPPTPRHGSRPIPDTSLITSMK